METNQGKVSSPFLDVVVPILVLSSGSKVVDDLDFPHVLPTIGDKVEHSFNKVVGAKSRSIEEDKALKSRNLGTAVALKKSRNVF